MSMATVIGPTPPGTGVILEAIGETVGKCTSPQSRLPHLRVGSGTRLMPTSMTTAPGLDHVGRHEFRAADGGDEDVGLPGDGGRPTVAE